MITLTHEQAQSLLATLTSTKGFLSTVETADSSVNNQRDSLIEDCNRWRSVILQELDQKRR